MKKLFYLICVFMLLLSVNSCSADNNQKIGDSEIKPLFWEDIQKFKNLDQAIPPPKNAILLIGSSSFTKWTDVANYFPDKIIINRGFGGSRLIDLNFYANALLDPYQPKQIIVYCGENDLVSKETSVDDAVARYKTFYRKIREKFPNIEVDYISIKRSPSREEFWLKMKKANEKIAVFMKEEENAEYIDITKVMEDGAGNPRKDLFVEDMLHMTPEGYLMWAQAMNPYMK